MSAAISVSNLSKVYGQQRAVDDITFDVPWGRVTGFLGPNGAGKSTTMRIILGLAHASSGDARVMGRSYGDIAEPSLSVGALLETHQFHPQRSGRNHLRVYAAAMGLSDSRVDEVLDLVDLTKAAHKKVGEYSLGMHQRLGLAAALLGDPKVLILDEPANGLDPAGIRWLRSFVRSFVRPDSAVFLSSHLLDEIAQMVDDVVVIHRGSLVAHAPVADLLAHAGSRVKARTDMPERLRDALIAKGANVEMVAHDLLLISGLQSEDVGRAALASGVPLFALETEMANLEDVFFELTAKEELHGSSLAQ